MYRETPALLGGFIPCAFLLNAVGNSFQKAIERFCESLFSNYIFCKYEGGRGAISQTQHRFQPVLPTSTSGKCFRTERFLTLEKNLKAEIAFYIAHFLPYGILGFVLVILRGDMKTSIKYAGITLLSVFMISCSDVGMSKTTQGAIAGTAVGAGLGAVVGDQVHHTGTGTAVGAGFGALTGGLIGAAMDDNEKNSNYDDERLRRQDEELRRQRREIDELRRERDADYYRNNPGSSGNTSSGRDDYRYNDRY